MANWSQKDLHHHMEVYSSESEQVGHVAEVYEDSFLLNKGLLSTKLYIPYSAIATVEKDRVQLTLSTNALADPQWKKRPDYENHLGDPTQLLYDEGHGVADPFVEPSTE
jgi:hypothetical protein